MGPPEGSPSHRSTIRLRGAGMSASAAGSGGVMNPPVAGSVFLSPTTLNSSISVVQFGLVGLPQLSFGPMKDW